MASKAVRPRRIVNLQSVEDLARSGLSRKGISKALHFGRDLFMTRPDILDAVERGEAALEAEIVGRLLDKVRNGCMVSTIFAAKALCGLVETGRKEEAAEAEPVKIYVPDNRRNPA